MLEARLNFSKHARMHFKNRYVYYYNNTNDDTSDMRLSVPYYYCLYYNTGTKTTLGYTYKNKLRIRIR
jgi:hypothetical protein